MAASHAKPSPSSAGASRHQLQPPSPVPPRLADAARRLADRFAIALDARLHRQRLRIARGLVSVERAGPLLADAPLIVALALEPAHAPAFILIDPALAGALVERGFGGRPAERPPGALDRPVGTAERREALALAEAAMAALAACGDDRLTLSARLIGTVSGGEALGMSAPDMMMAALGCDGHFGSGNIAGEIRLLLPASALGAATVLQATLGARDDLAQARWRQRLAARAGDIAMPTKSVIARPQLSVGQVMALRVGDVIPIPVPRHVPLLVADRRVATGTIGERDGRVAFMVDRMDGGLAR